MERRHILDAADQLLTVAIQALLVIDPVGADLLGAQGKVAGPDIEQLGFGRRKGPRHEDIAVLVKTIDLGMGQNLNVQHGLICSRYFRWIPNEK